VKLRQRSLRKKDSTKKSQKDGRRARGAIRKKLLLASITRTFPEKEAEGLPRLQTMKKKLQNRSKIKGGRREPEERKKEGRHTGLTNDPHLTNEPVIAIPRARGGTGSGWRKRGGTRGRYIQALVTKKFSR